MGFRVYNYESLSELAAFGTKTTPERSMTTIDFTAKGDFLVSGDDQGNVIIWDTSDTIESDHREVENSLRTTIAPIVAAKWFRYKPFAENYRFICLVQDGTAQLYQFQFVDKNAKSAIYVHKKLGKNKLKSKINLLCALHLYDELKTRSPLWSYNIRSCNFLLINETSSVIGVVWPEKVSYGAQKISSDKLGEMTKITYFENKLKIALLYDSHNPRVGNPLSSIPSAKNVTEYAPGYKGKTTLDTDAYIFYLDNEKQNICSYCNATGETKILFNIIKETDTMQNIYSKLEVRPKSGGGLYDTYRFLILSEIDRQYNMCFMFAYNMQKKRFSEHVKQFSGIDCIFIGNERDESPPLLILQEDMQTIMITELKVKDDIGLPRGDLKLKTMIKSLYPTPFRNGLAVVYVCNNKIKFSRNRMEENSFDDFKILEGTRDYFRLNYNEVIFNIVWQDSVNRSEEDIHGALITNEKIHIINSRLRSLQSIRIGSNYNFSFIFSSYWLGKALLFTTESHLHYTNISGDSNIIFTFDNLRGVICNAMADRVSIASYNSKNEVVITTRKVHLLEPLLMGELSYVKEESEFDSELFK